jgi:hypothetical protein
MNLSDSRRVSLFLGVGNRPERSRSSQQFLVFGDDGYVQNFLFVSRSSEYRWTLESAVVARASRVLVTVPRPMVPGSCTRKLRGREASLFGLHVMTLPLISIALKDVMIGGLPSSTKHQPCASQQHRAPNIHGEDKNPCNYESFTEECRTLLVRRRVCNAFLCATRRG